VGGGDRRQRVRERRSVFGQAVRGRAAGAGHSRQSCPCARTGKSSADSRADAESDPHARSRAAIVAESRTDAGSDACAATGTDANSAEPDFIEGSVPGGGSSGDRHLLVVDRDRWLLFELYARRWNASASRWEAGSGAIFNMSGFDRRPEGWTSADAAGLAILPGLVRYEEAMSGRDIRHAFRVTVRATNSYVWPASHRAGSTPGALPMGARLRLKASKDLSGFPPALRRIFRAMQVYGLIVADNGSDLYISGAMDSRWNNDQLNPAFRALTAGDFEVIQLGWR
jgi:hypothetical protein